MNISPASSGILHMIGYSTYMHLIGTVFPRDWAICTLSATIDIL
jgi:hypothetical protein